MFFDWIDFRLQVLLANLEYLENKYDIKTSRLLIRAHLARLACIVLGLGKILVGIVSLSIFMIMNGFYTLGMAGAKSIILYPVYYKSDKDEVYFCKMAGIVMVVSSFLYILYSLSLVYHPKTIQYNEFVQAVIIVITSLEILCNLWGILKYKHYQYHLIESLKIICLGSSMISAVLALAIMLANLFDWIDLSINGILGVIVGFFVALMGAYLLGKNITIENMKKIGSK